MEVQEFTDVMVRKLKPDHDRHYVIWELGKKGERGFGIRVLRSGLKVWVFVYSFGGRRRWMMLGRYPAKSLADARAAYRDALGKRNNGIDPGAEVQAAKVVERGAVTVEYLANQFITNYASAGLKRDDEGELIVGDNGKPVGTPRKKSWKDDDRLLKNEVLPHLGTMKAADVHRRDVMALLDGIVARGAGVTANRVLAVLRKAYNWGISRELVEFSPCAQVPKPTVEHERERFLSADELRRFLLGLATTDLADISKTTRQALRFQLATGARPGEAAGATWQEFDLQAGWWTIPAERTKTHHEHTLPLSRYARQVLAEVRLLNPLSPCPFPGNDGVTPIRPLTLAHALHKNLAALGLERFTPHDLRRSCATHLASLGHSRVVISRILGHALPGVTRIYDRHAYAEEMRAALDEWGAVLDRLSRPAEPETVKRRARK